MSLWGKGRKWVERKAQKTWGRAKDIIGREDTYGDWSYTTDDYGNRWKIRKSKLGYDVQNVSGGNISERYKTGETSSGGTRYVSYDKLEEYGGASQWAELKAYLNEEGEGIQKRMVDHAYGQYGGAGYDKYSNTGGPQSGKTGYGDLQRLITAAKDGNDERDIYNLGITILNDIGVPKHLVYSKLPQFVEKFKEGKHMYFLDPFSDEEKSTLKTMRESEAQYKGGGLGEAYQEQQSYGAGRGGLGGGGASVSLDVKKEMGPQQPSIGPTAVDKTGQIKSQKAQTFMENIISGMNLDF